MSASSFQWQALPSEMKLTIIDTLDVRDVNALAQVNHDAFRLCIPSRFRQVKFTSFEKLLTFLDCVPRDYYQHIQQLDISTKSSRDVVEINAPHPRTDAIVSLLGACAQLEQLSLNLAGSLAKHIIPCFAHFPDLKRLSINNLGDEDRTPISERLVVSIAASIPNLQELSLDRISRSALHAPELIGAYPHVPLVLGDHDIEAHPLLGSELSLPSLLRLPTLKSLTLRDIHLGDPRWETTPVASCLKVLDTGSCYHETEDVNMMFTERIILHAGSSLEELTLSTPLVDNKFAELSTTPLKNLRTLSFSPIFPVDSLLDTLNTLAGSPIETIAIRCYDDDTVDVCAALEDLLNVKVERDPELFPKLVRLSVASIAACEGSPLKEEDNLERHEAFERLQRFCGDLHVACSFQNVASSTPSNEDDGRGHLSAVTTSCRGA